MNQRMASRISVLLLLGVLTLSVNAGISGANTRCAERSTQSVEAHIHVPFYYQEEEYYCGPAVLQMVFDYWGENISQSEIADVARTIGEPMYLTYTDDLRRAAHFSNTSTSTGNELPDNITGYALRGLGYAASEAHNIDLATLKNWTAEGKPLILLMWYSSRHVSTHYRVVTGYNETHIFLHDPWNRPLWNGTYGGPHIAFNNSAFMDLWSYYDNWALYVSPWRVSVSVPEYIKAGTPFRIESIIAYPNPLPNSLALYSASLCTASISLPANLSLAQGENQRKIIGSGTLPAGTSSTVNWTVLADSPVTDQVIVTAEGTISGSVGAHENYTAYDYSDRIAGTANFTVELREDKTAPIMATPLREPETDVQPSQEVKVSVNVTDTESGVQNVTLFYMVDDGPSWESRAMILNESMSLYETTIPGQQAGASVRFKIVAYDRVGSNATLDGTEPYCTYQVVPELTSAMMILLLTLATLLILVVCCREHSVSAERRSFCESELPTPQASNGREELALNVDETESCPLGASIEMERRSRW